MSSPQPRQRLAVATSGAAEAVAARHGPASDRPALRKDLVFRRQVQLGRTVWIVKNPEAMKYYYFDDSEWGLIELFDGTRSRFEILEEYRQSFPEEGIEFSLILEYEELLRKLELLERTATERSLALLNRFKSERQRAAEEKSEGRNPFRLLFHVVDPDRFLNRTVKYVRWIWTPPAVLIWSILMLWTIGIFIRHWEPIWTGTYELYAFLHKPLIDVIQFFFILCFIGGIHELGHAYATKIYGGDVHDIGIALLYFTPAFYCDTTDSILFESRWQRLWVTTAGIYIEGFLCAGATALWVASYPDTVLHEIAYKTMLFTGVSTIFFNINPLIKIDGYYALASYLEMWELREESFRYIGAVFQRSVLRLPVEVPMLPRRRKRIYLVYGVLALAYTVVIMRFIGGLFFNFYSKYFPNVAVVLLLLTLYRIFRKRVRLLTRTARLLYLDKKEFLMSKALRPKLLGVGAFLLVVFLVPWTHEAVSVEAVLRPARVARIEAPEDGTVSAVLAREQDSVSQGSEILRLSNPATQAGAAHYAAENHRLQKAASHAREMGAADALYRSQQREAAAAAGLRSEEFRQRSLALKTPIAGTLLTPRMEDLEGRTIRAGTLLAEVGDCRTLVADLPISERLLDRLRVGASVHALAGQRPLRPIQGHVTRISSATLDQPATSAGTTDSAAPPEHPERFVATAQFANSDGQLRPGTVVRAKIYAARSSYAGRAWRVLRRWIQTIIW